MLCRRYLCACIQHDEEEMQCQDGDIPEETLSAGSIDDGGHKEEEFRDTFPNKDTEYMELCKTLLEVAKPVLEDEFSSTDIFINNDDARINIEDIAINNEDIAITNENITIDNEDNCTSGEDPILKYTSDVKHDTEGAVEAEQNIANGDISTSKRVSERASIYSTVSTSSRTSKSVNQGFAGSSNILIAIQYRENKFVGSIKEIEGLILDDNQCPDKISFHIKVISQETFRFKTSWVALQQGSTFLGLDLSLGPFSKEVHVESKIRFRLYGKRKKKSKIALYGEYVVPANSIIQTGELMEIRQSIYANTL